MIATADGGVIGYSGITYDQNGIATGMMGTATQSWTGGVCPTAPSVESVAGPWFDEAGASFWTTAGGNPSGNGTAIAQCPCLLQSTGAALEPDATRKQSYYDYAVAWGESPTHPWLLANTKAGVMSTDANNQACGQTYIDLYKIDPQPIRIQEIKANLDDMVTNGTSNVWWGIDAIQMSMPVFAKMGALQNDTKYFDAMWNLYNDSRTQEGGGLWNRADGLWWRDLHYTPSLPSAGDGGTDGVSAGGMDGASAGGSDARSDSGIDGRMDGPSAGIADGGGDGGSDGGAAVVPDWSSKQTITLAMSQALPAQTQDSYIVAPNGKSIYWSRGNGWVFVALARVLDILPSDDPHRDTYVSDFKAMARALVPLQRSDGFWNASLLDPNQCASIGKGGDDGPETSGTAFERTIESGCRRRRGLPTAA